VVLGSGVGNDELVGHGASIQAVKCQPEHLGLSAGELARAGKQVHSLGSGRGADVHRDPAFEQFGPDRGPTVRAEVHTCPRVAGPGALLLGEEGSALVIGGGRHRRHRLRGREQLHQGLRCAGAQRAHLKVVVEEGHPRVEPRGPSAAAS
jgi:hypothetical protein